MGFLAFVFPGQGAQHVGMGQKLYEASPAARALMDRAEEGMPGLLDLCFKGPLERLTETDVAQPALFTVSLAAAAAAREAGLVPKASAGFSLGEWTAITFGGLLPFEQAFPLVKQRAAWMQQSATRKPGGMAAILRKNAEEVKGLIQGHDGVYAVNFNAPDQVVVAGEHQALNRFQEDMKAQGVRAVKLNVSGAFHSPLMAEAGHFLAAELEHVQFSQPRFPVYSNLTARPHDPDQAAQALARQVTSSVLWVDSITNMSRSGCTSFLELGPGNVLSGLIKKILPEAQVFSAEDLEGIQAAAYAMGEQA